jgi:hypothetical protein
MHPATLKSQIISKVRLYKAGGDEGFFMILIAKAAHPA